MKFFFSRTALVSFITMSAMVFSPFIVSAEHAQGDSNHHEDRRSATTSTPSWYGNFFGRSVKQAGFITSVDGLTHSFKLSTPTAATILTTTSTKIFGPNGLPLTFSDLFVGNQVRVSGTFNSSTQITTARTIQVIFYEALSVPLTLNGTLTSMGTSTAVTELVIRSTKVTSPVVGAVRSISSVNQDVTVAVNPTSIIFDAYGEKRMVSDLAIGDSMHIIGWLDRTGIVSVSTLQDMSLHLMPAYADGAITIINSSTQSFVLETESTTYTVKTGPTTRIVIPLDITPTFEELQLADRVVVYGVVNDQTKTIFATSVHVVD